MQYSTVCNNPTNDANRAARWSPAVPESRGAHVPVRGYVNVNGSYKRKRPLQITRFEPLRTAYVSKFTVE